MRVYDGIVMDRAYVYNTRGTGRISADKKKGEKRNQIVLIVILNPCRLINFERLSSIDEKSLILVLCFTFRSSTMRK